MLQRLPNPRLRPYVETLWASSRKSAPPDRKETTLPGVAPCIIFRVDGSSLRLLGPDGKPSHIGQAVVSGAQQQPFAKELNCIAAVGAVIRPGALPVFTRTSATELTNQHLALNNIWKPRDTERLTEQLAETVELEKRLQILEDFLLLFTTETVTLNPVTTSALHNLRRDTSIHELRQSSGLSHRHFNRVFSQYTGLLPKSYQRLLRIKFVLSSINADPTSSWSKLAADAGFSDQSHLNRDFSELCKMTPTEYVSSNRRGPLHIVH